jgi:phenylalanyl-tRNA synthetase beta chain
LLQSEIRVEPAAGSGAEPEARGFPVKLPISWLREWIELDATAEAVADALTRRGFYVEGIETHGHAYPGVVVARVIEVSRHPNADRLSLCRVDGGAGELQVVCGAPNVTAGMLAPLATVGARLPNGVVIGASKIRGVESQGMLCSPRELEMSDEHQGILDLVAHLGSGEGLTAGRPLDQLLGPAEQVLEVEVPFNRPDALGIVGLAREVRAALDGRWTAAASARLANRWQGRADFDLELEDAEGCPRYLAQVVEEIEVVPSPAWLRRRLESMGQRAINLIVDLTNFVLFEYGQPLHAFDLASLRGPAIRVRRARAGERIVTLDAKDRALDPEVLVIADRERPVAIAGVMGGAETEVTSATRTLLLECAWFHPRRIRRGARALGLATEASKRYERGVDPEIGPAAAARFLALLKETLPGVRPAAARERNTLDGKRRTLTLRPSRCTRLLGLAVTAPEMRRHLESFEFAVEAGDPLRVTVPPWRSDIAFEDDLVEEVARANGYDRIPEAPLETRGRYATRSALERTLEAARVAMLARGLTEAWTTSLLGEREALTTAGLLGEEPRLVRLRNPMSREGECLRPSPVAGLLRACAHNLRQGRAAVRLFEVGTGFRDLGGKLPEERPMLAALVTGAPDAHAHDPARPPVDFEQAKGLWEAWLDEMRVDTPQWRTYSAPGWKPGASAEVASGTSRIGWTGTLSQSLLREWDIEVPARHDVHLFVALLEPLSRSEAARPRVLLPGRFPPVRRDVAFFVPEHVTHREVEQALAGAAGERLASIEVFDVYAGPGTPKGMKSLAYALQFQHSERTLTEAEVQTIQDRMTAAVTAACGGQLRER